MSRLRISQFATFEQQLFELRTSKTGLSIVSFNCQSLRAHAQDLLDRVVKHANILLLSETFMADDGAPVHIPKFNFVVRVQRNEKRNSGVAIYHKSKTKSILLLHIWI